MFLHTAADKRPYHLGTFPLEVLPRDDAIAAAEAARAPIAAPAPGITPEDPFGAATRSYRALFAGLLEDEEAPAQAPVPDDRRRRVVDLKGYAYFMNASQVGICRIPENAWYADGERARHEYAVAILVERERLPEIGNPAREWVAPAADEVPAMRAAEIAVCLARHIRRMGFPARAHIVGHGLLDAERLAILAGLAVRHGDTVRNPFIDGPFALAIVSTEYALATDRPLATGALRAKGPRYWLGRGGATSGRERNRRAKRATHLSRFAMETVKRVERPTTLILDDEVPRVPKRAAIFDRALRGDLGEKTQKERNRFAFKQPHTSGMMAPMRAMVPGQDGEVADADTGLYADPAANSRALKSLAYFLGADIAGICEVPEYAWFSHDSEGKPIRPKHKYALVMMIDQEYDTMEGASGDDWISGAQSMRAYLRGAEIAGIIADTLRRLGFPARSQTNVDSDVLHIPLMVWAGLGELSRIGELVLNPFLGPRTKTVVLTTDMKLLPDKPIDFGLQYFCENCTKCARECPCSAIPLGGKTMFNGYEMWKPDVERCGRYRLTNAKGSACGRCMKTCPLNKVITADGPLLTRIASWCGINAPWLKPVLVPVAVWLDDYIGNGTRNPVKKWWLDLEIVDGICVEPVHGINRRDIDTSLNTDPAKQKMAVYHADMMPVPNDTTKQPVDRKAAMAAVMLAETPTEALARRARGEGPPAHYIPTPPAACGPMGPKSKPMAYGGGTGKAARR